MTHVRCPIRCVGWGGTSEGSNVALGFCHRFLADIVERWVACFSPAWDQKLSKFRVFRPPTRTTLLKWRWLFQDEKDAIHSRQLCLSGA